MQNDTEFGWPRRAGLVVLAALMLVAWGCDNGVKMDYAQKGSEPEKSEKSPPYGAGELADKGDIEVTDITLGRSIGPEKEVTRATKTFKPDDTVFASVVMRGYADDSWLTGRWFRQIEGGDKLKQIHKTRFRASPDGVAVTEMHMGATPDPLEPGKYRVEIRLNGTIVGVRDFVVVESGEEVEGT